MSNYRIIDITKDDLKLIIYFVLMKFRSDPLHLQGTSSKRDLIGGYIERWFNKVAETLVFNDLLKEKKYNVVCDYFLYGNDSQKNAPDILGIKTDTEKNIPFVQYDNGKWLTVNEMPRIEVKAIKQDQWLLGIREPQMIDDYYVFIETDLKGDYLTAIFDEEIFDEKYFKKLEMSKDFILRDIDNQIVPHSTMSKAEVIGTLKLIGIYTKDEIRNNTVLCGKNISPFYFSSATNVERVIKSSDIGEILNVDNSGKVNYQGVGDSTIYLPFSITVANQRSAIKIIKKNKGSLYIETKEPLIINGNSVSAGYVKIGFKKFDRSSPWDENICSKYMLEHYAKDSTQTLISLFDKIYESRV